MRTWIYLFSSSIFLIVFIHASQKQTMSAAWYLQSHTHEIYTTRQYSVQAAEKAFLAAMRLGNPMKPSPHGLECLHSTKTQITNQQTRLPDCAPRNGLPLEFHTAPNTRKMGTKDLGNDRNTGNATRTRIPMFRISSEIHQSASSVPSCSSASSSNGSCSPCALGSAVRIVASLATRSV